MWQPVDTKFYYPRHPVEVVALPNALEEALRLRPLLESLAAVVHLSSIGTPGDLLQVLSQGEAASPYLVLCGHGNEVGLVFGDFISTIDTSMLQQGSLPPASIVTQIHLPGCVVINTACDGGEAPMAEAFMAGGLKGYLGMIAPNPSGFAVLLFVHHFFYQLFVTECPLYEAWRQAAAYDHHSRLFVYYDHQGRHHVSSSPGSQA